MIQIIYSDVAPGADNDATYSGQTQSYALLDNLSAGASPCLIATGEPGRWKLDGSVDILGYVDADYGYVSAAQSNTSGKYAAGVGLDITLTGSYTSSGLTILFDPFEDVQYAVKVSWYNGDTLLHSAEYTAGGAELVIERIVTLYNKIKVEFVSSSKPLPLRAHTAGHLWRGARFYARGFHGRKPDPRGQSNIRGSCHRHKLLYPAPTNADAIYVPVPPAV